jgi:late competence protein required for DNA uptake (superfamily II DNA/RNA helicase)
MNCVTCNKQIFNKKPSMISCMYCKECHNINKIDKSIKDNISYKIHFINDRDILSRINDFINNEINNIII